MNNFCKEENDVFGSSQDIIIPKISTLVKSCSGMGSNEKKEKFKIGDDYYIPHLKLFRNDSDARIYFKIDKERKKFILGKIGRHAK